jgi:glycosyltransferase involved in cell wall biosynthesis
MSRHKHGKSEPPTATLASPPPKPVLLLFKALGPGGAEQLLINSATYLDRSQFHYEVAYLLPQLNGLVGDLERLGLRVHCLRGTKGGVWMARLRSLVRDLKPRIVHVHSPYAAIGARLALKRPGGPRLVYTEHSVWDYYHPMTRRGNQMTFPLNDHVFAVSEHVRRSIRYSSGLRFLPMPPVETLYHGLDPVSMRRWQQADGVRESLGIPPDAPVVGTVANFRTEKGHRYLLEAAVLVRQSLPDARFVLVGHGPLEDALRRQVRQMQLEPNVIFTGTRNDAPRLTASFDVFALPSVYEGLSVALIEALCVGTPVVVTRTGGLMEVISDDVNGVTVPARDPVALGSAIVALLSDPSRRRRLAEAGKIRAEDFDIRRAVHRTEEVYKGLLA